MPNYGDDRRQLPESAFVSGWFGGREKLRMFRVVTVAREYGSAGGAIARRVAQVLRWNLLDKNLAEAIARSAQVDPDLVWRYDERADSWLHRVSRRGLWHGAIEAVATVTDADFFDAETMTGLARNLITEAYSRGKCVIVGRGAQCVLQGCQDALHVFIRAPWSDRMDRVRARVPDERDVEQLIRCIDQQRADHIATYFGYNWKDPRLYQMVISSELGEEYVARTIIEVIQSPTLKVA